MVFNSNLTSAKVPIFVILRERATEESYKFFLKEIIDPSLRSG